MAQDADFWGSYRYNKPPEPDEDPNPSWYSQAAAAGYTGAGNTSQVSQPGLQSPQITQGTSPAQPSQPSQPYTSYIPPTPTPTIPNQSVGENVATQGGHLQYQQEPTPTYEDLMSQFGYWQDLYQQGTGQQLPGNVMQQFAQEGTLVSPLEQQPHQGIYPEWVPNWMQEGLELLGSGAMMSGLTTGSTGPGTTMGNEPITSHNLALQSQWNELDNYRTPREGPFGLQEPQVGHGWQGFHDAPSAHGLLVDYLNQLAFQRAMEDYYQPLSYWGGSQPSLPVYGGGGGGYPASPSNPYWWLGLVRWNI